MSLNILETETVGYDTGFTDSINHHKFTEFEAAGFEKWSFYLFWHNIVVTQLKKTTNRIIHDKSYNCLEWLIKGLNGWRKIVKMLETLVSKKLLKSFIDQEISEEWPSHGDLLRQVLNGLKKFVKFLAKITWLILSLVKLGWDYGMFFWKLFPSWCYQGKI